MKAIVNTMIANLHSAPEMMSELTDEVFYGMTVEILEICGEAWLRVETPYRYKGYCLRENLLISDELVTKWRNEAKYIVIQNFADVLLEPKIQSSKIMTLVKGSTIKVVKHQENGDWTKVELASGEVGYTRTHWIQDKIEQMTVSEEEFREKVVRSALSYLSTPYRWGGKTPVGIDCSGLCSMAYMLNGVIIYRDAKIVEGFPIKEIQMDLMQKGDLLYFPGHIAMYIGDSLYVHSSLGGNEVSINSLNEQHPKYRQDLATTITAVGSLFAPK
nr:SH3 domain-containing C40 family peptidase [Lysinibacillus timonensis]